MGRGDKRSEKGKRFKGSFGNSRPQRKKKNTKASADASKKQKPVAKTEKPAVKKAPAKKAAKKKED
jgi:30S ribosomal protein S31